MGQIKLEDIEIYAYHGCYTEEQVAGNWFRVNVTLDTNMDVPSESDAIEDALNYQQVGQIIQREMNQKSHLLEHVCHRIMHELFHTFPQLEEATIEVSKMNPPVGLKMKCVTVSMTQHR